MNIKLQLVGTKRNIIALLCVMLSTAFGADNEEYRTFSDRQGQTFKGRVLDYEAASEVVFIERSDRKRGRKPLAMFSDADRIYILDWSAARSFREGLGLEPALRTISVSKKESGITDLTKKVFDSFYEIQFSNASGARFGKIDYEYCIFYNQGIRDDRTVHYEEGTCHGKGVVERLDPSARHLSKTRSVRLYTEGGRVGLFGSATVSLANVRGIWLRLRTTLPSGREIEREYRTSDDELWEWSAYTFGAGLNEGAKKQTYYYVK